MDTVLRLGDFEFTNLEVPESLPLGGAQRLAIHNFPGGARNIQALGPDHAPISWRGLMLGGTALDRAKGLDFMRVQGFPKLLTVWDSTYMVVIERFEFNPERYYKVPYSITVQVVSDDSQPVEDIPPAGFDTSIQDDCDSLGALGDIIGDSPLSTAISTLNSTISTVNSFATATSSVVSSVVGAISSVSSRADVLTAGVKAVLNSAGVVGGVVPSSPLAASIASMTAQVKATAQYPVLLNIGSLADRMMRNVMAANQQNSTRLIQVAGGTLFDVAAAQYGDATRWTAIAAASGIKDAILTGVNTLQIPARPVDSGGVPIQ